MSILLSFIINADRQGKDRPEDWERILLQLKNLKLDTTSYPTAGGKYIKETGDWHYHKETGDGFFTIEFEGPFHINISLYKDSAILSTIYRYWLIYDNHLIHWFNDFRKDLYDIMRIFGGTEGIYLPDNNCKRLSFYYECLARENVSYEDLKSIMIKDFGKPVTDYSEITKFPYSCMNPKVFFLDDFKDFFN